MPTTDRPRIGQPANHPTRIRQNRPIRPERAQNGQCQARTIKIFFETSVVSLRHQRTFTYNPLNSSIFGTLANPQKLGLYVSCGSKTTQESQEDCIMTDVPDRILRLRSVLARTGLSRSTLYRKIQQGSFPRQIPISTRCAGWRESAINEWMKNPMFYHADDRPSV